MGGGQEGHRLNRQGRGSPTSGNRPIRQGGWLFVGGALSFFQDVGEVQATELHYLGAFWGRHKDLLFKTNKKTSEGLLFKKSIPLRDWGVSSGASSETLAAHLHETPLECRSDDRQLGDFWRPP